MKKKATDYAIGDRFLEADDYDAGTVVSLMVDPTRQSRAFILVCSDKGAYTLYACPRDAVSKAYLARNIPEPVMRQFLFDIYMDGNELVHTPGMTARVPVRLPEYKPVRSARPAPLPSEGEEVVEGEPLSRDDDGSAPVSGVVPESVPVQMLPEVDFP